MVFYRNDLSVWFAEPLGDVREFDVEAVIGRECTLGGEECAVLCNAGVNQWITLFSGFTSRLLKHSTKSLVIRSAWLYQKSPRGLSPSFLYSVWRLVPLMQDIIAA